MENDYTSDSNGPNLSIAVLSVTKGKYLIGCILFTYTRFDVSPEYCERECPIQHNV